MVSWGDSRIPRRLWELLIPVPFSGCWLYLGGQHSNGYGRYYIDRVELKPHRLMFEAVFGPVPDGFIIDHRCREKLCCNPADLRLATHHQNHQNVIAPRSNTSGYKGVHFSRASNRWQARIRNATGRRLFLGNFSTPEEAARAYDDAARIHHGDFKVLNFPAP